MLLIHIYATNMVYMLILLTRGIRLIFVYLLSTLPAHAYCLYASMYIYTLVDICLCVYANLYFYSSMCTGLVLYMLIVHAHHPHPLTAHTCNQFSYV